MSIHINIVCDHIGCIDDLGRKTAFPLLFDSIDETWGNMIDYILHDMGWRLEMKGAKVLTATCPKHQTKE